MIVCCWERVVLIMPYPITQKTPIDMTGNMEDKQKDPWVI